MLSNKSLFTSYGSILKLCACKNKERSMMLYKGCIWIHTCAIRRPGNLSGGWVSLPSCRICGLKTLCSLVSVNCLRKKRPSKKYLKPHKFTIHIITIIHLPTEKRSRADKGNKTISFKSFFLWCVFVCIPISRQISDFVHLQS